MFDSLLRRLVALIVLPIAAVCAGPAQSQTPAEFSEWLYHYSSGDLRADYNGDGVLTPADFTAFIRFHTDTNVGGDDGWTEFEESPDTIKIYVSPRGNDSNNGRSEANAVQTLSKAYSLLRNGRPDWMLIERGSIFNESFPSWQKSGRSQSEPMVVTTYGSSSDRPQIRTGTRSGLVSASDDFRRHLRFVGFELVPHLRTNEVPAGISFVGPMEDILVEDVLVRGYATGMVFQASNDARGANLRIRRSVVVDNWASGQHSQGMFFRSIDGVTIEECVVDRNGWLPQLEDQTRTIFNHNVYIQRNVTGLRFTENFVSRGASHGLQARNGGAVERNVFWQNPTSILWGNEGGSDEMPVRGAVANNVLLDGVDLNETARGWGILIENVERGRIEENIFANSASTPFASWGIGIGGPDSAPVFNLTVEGNVFYNWYNAFSVLRRTAQDISVLRNTFVTNRPEEVLIDHRIEETFDNVVYSGNEYFQSDSSQRWFAFDFREITLAQWIEDFDRQARVLQSPAGRFPNQNWTLNSYASSNGFGNAESLVSSMRTQRRGLWREPLTARSVVDDAREAFGLPALP